MLSASELLARIVAAPEPEAEPAEGRDSDPHPPEPERGVCRKCGRPAAVNLLWLCADCADAIHEAAAAGAAESEARMVARVMEIGERFRFPYDLYLDAGRASWERKARTFPERALQAAEAYAAKLERDDRKELPF